MDSKALVFLRLVSGPRQYQIPPFQRPYSWEREDRETLWLDILNQYEVVKDVFDLPESEREEKLKSISTHYLGTIVLSGPSSLGVPKSDIIDGQQRIATLLLAICALRDLWGQRLATEAGTAIAEAKRRTMSNTYLVNDGEEGLDRYRVIPLSTDERCFKACINYAGTGKMDATTLQLGASDSQRMLQAYKFFRTEMGRQKVGDANPQLARFAHLYPLKPAVVEQVIAHRLSVIAIETQNLDNINSIFESLNAKGRPLTQLDLLRNYIFMTLQSRASIVLEEQWNPIEKVHLPKPRDFENFVWADVVSRGTNILQKRAYRTIQAEIREQGGTPDVAESYVVRLNRRAPVYAKLMDPTRESHVDLSKSLIRLERAGGKTAKPLLLWLYEQAHLELCSPADLVDCVKHLESFLVRRFLCAMPPNNLNSMFGTMLSRLENDMTYDSAMGPTLERLRAVMLATPKEWPDDEVLLDGVLKHDFYHNGETAQRLHILQSLDLAYGYGLPPGYDESDDSIEHILPQSSQAAWVSDLKALGEVLASTQERVVHTLGNLTVVTPSDNAKLGVRRFAEKIEIFDTLDYKMTKDVINFGTEVAGDLLWGRVQIETRGASLATSCISIWPRPLSSVLGGSVGPVTSDDEYDLDSSDLVPFTSAISEDADSGG